jgi:Domain of unknown function (DUF5668)
MGRLSPRTRRRGTGSERAGRSFREEMSTQGQVLGYCRACGKALDETNVVNAQGTIYCKEHAPMSSAESAVPPPPPGAGFGQSPYTSSPYSTPYSAPFSAPPVANPEVSPGLAFLLGAIPGVGAIYNGQYAKGLIHVVILGLMIAILSNGGMNGLEPMMGLMIAAFFAYMCFEAYHTAKQRRMGMVVDEFSSLLPTRGGSRFPAAPVVLIVLGIVFLLNNLELFELRRALRYWPVLMIGLGVYMLFLRFGQSKPEDKIQ